MDFADPGPLTMIATGLAGSAIFLVQAMRRIPSGYRSKFTTVAVAHIIGAVISTVVQALAAAVVIGGIGVAMLAITCATHGEVETFFEPSAVGLAGHLSR